MTAEDRALLEALYAWLTIGWTPSDRQEWAAALRRLLDAQR